MIYAVLPAAGMSTRMGRPKLALPLGETTVLERVIQTLKHAAVDRILVVLSPQVATLQRLAEAAGADVHLLDTQTEDMRATILAGLDWLERRHHPGERDAFLLVPADHPTLQAAVVRALLAARDASADRSIFVPTYHGRRGHPTLVCWNHVAALRQFPRGSGLNTYFRQESRATQEVPMEDPSILVDLDTPGDYLRLLETEAEG